MNRPFVNLRNVLMHGRLLRAESQNREPPQRSHPARRCARIDVGPRPTHSVALRDVQSDASQMSHMQ